MAEQPPPPPHSNYIDQPHYINFDNAFFRIYNSRKIHMAGNDEVVDQHAPSKTDKTEEEAVDVSQLK